MLVVGCWMFPRFLDPLDNPVPRTFLNSLGSWLSSWAELLAVEATGG